MLSNTIGAEFREVADRQWDGKPAKAVVAARVYDTDPKDLWDALTNPERIPRWFSPVTGELKLGGRYQIQGNAGGTITRCDPPRAAPPQNSDQREHSVAVVVSKGRPAQRRPPEGPRGVDR